MVPPIVRVLVGEFVGVGEELREAARMDEADRFFGVDSTRS